MLSLLLGHLVGDYLLQNDWLAKGKSKAGIEGMCICVLHCIIYAVVVATFITLDGWRCSAFTRTQDILFLSAFDYSWLYALSIAFITHYPIDRLSIGSKWMALYGQTKEGPFAPLIYVAVDNSMHLVLMYMLFRSLGA